MDCVPVRTQMGKLPQGVALSEARRGRERGCHASVSRVSSSGSMLRQALRQGVDRMSCLHQPIAPAWADAHAPCAVINIHAEMVFWADTYASQPFHRPAEVRLRRLPALAPAVAAGTAAQPPCALPRRHRARRPAGLAARPGRHRTRVGTAQCAAGRRPTAVPALAGDVDGRARDPRCGDAPALSFTRGMQR